MPKKTKQTRNEYERNTSDRLPQREPPCRLSGPTATKCQRNTRFYFMSSRLGHVENSFFMSLFSALLFYSFFFSRLIFLSSFSSLLLLFLFFLFSFFSPLLFVLSFSLLSPIRHRWKFIKFISLARYNFTSSEQTLVEVTCV